MREGTAPDRRFTLLARVRCLDCDGVYAKPSRGGTVEENPGCPHCGYLGWIPAAVDVRRDAAPIRSVVDLRQRRASRRR